MIKEKEDQKKEVREAMRGGAGSVSLTHYFVPEEFHANVRLCSHLTLPAGAGIGEHAHVGEDEVYIILHGEGILTDNGTEKKVKAGDAILTGNGASHALRNPGPDELKLIALIMKY
jgi:mannose-6-phosphate isomerase-like protein (cupin superfamily)